MSHRTNTVAFYFVCFCFNIGKVLLSVNWLEPPVRWQFWWDCCLSRYRFNLGVFELSRHSALVGQSFLKLMLQITATICRRDELKICAKIPRYPDTDQHTRYWIVKTNVWSPISAATLALNGVVENWWRFMVAELLSLNWCNKANIISTNEFIHLRLYILKLRNLLAQNVLSGLIQNTSEPLKIWKSKYFLS